jgi:hypothetical protein
METMTTIEQIAAIQIERDDARQDLRDTLADVNEKVGQAESEMRPDHVIESHPVGRSLVDSGGFGLSVRLDRQQPRRRPDSNRNIARRRNIKTRFPRRKLKSDVHDTTVVPVTERHSDTPSGASETLEDWPTLLGRAVDDVTRILQSEAKMLETSMAAALETRLASALATLAAIAVMICGGVCILCAAILLLHEWLPL